MAFYLRMCKKNVTFAEFLTKVKRMKSKYV